MKKRRILALLLTMTLVFGAFALTACGPGEEAPAPEQPEVAEEPADDEDVIVEDDDGEVEEAPVVTGGGIDGVLRFVTTGVDGRFTPITASNVYDNYVNSLIFDSLISNDAEGNPIPLLASEWETSDDYLTYTFTIDSRATFSDGVPVTAADVAFTFSTIAHPEYDGPRGYAIANMLGVDEFRDGEVDEFPAIEIIDDQTIAFTFQEPSPVNIWSFTYGIVPEHLYAFEVWDEFLDMELHPIGSGRFLFVEYRPMELVRLEANTNHWNPDRVPQLDEILMLDVPNELLLDAFATDQADLAQPATMVDAYNDFTALAGVEVLNVQTLSYQFMAFNTLRPQLEDTRVRQALIYALDRAAFIEITVGPMGSVGMAPLAPASWAFPDDEGLLNAYDFNLDRAAELMEEAGWEMGDDGVRVRNGVRMELVWPVYTEVPWPGLLAELAYDSWRELGVDLTIELTDFNTVGERAFDMEPGEKDFCVFAMGFSLAIDPDPSGGLFDYDAFEAGGFCVSGFNHPRAQELIAEGRATFDQEERKAIYAEWAQIMNYELPTVIVAYRNEIWAVANHVRGVVINTFEDWTYHAHNITIN